MAVQNSLVDSTSFGLGRAADGDAGGWAATAGMSAALGAGVFTDCRAGLDDGSKWSGSKPLGDFCGDPRLERTVPFQGRFQIIAPKYSTGFVVDAGVEHLDEGDSVGPTLVSDGLPLFRESAASPCGALGAVERTTCGTLARLLPQLSIRAADPSDPLHQLQSELISDESMVGETGGG